MKIQKISREGYEKFEFPLNEVEIEGLLKKLPKNDIEGLEGIIITPPIKNADHNRFGRYDRNLKRIYLFAHLKIDGIFIIEPGSQFIRLTEKEFKNKATQAIFHEVGHHKGIKDFDDQSEDFANDYQLQKVTRHFPLFILIGILNFSLKFIGLSCFRR